MGEEQRSGGPRRRISRRSKVLVALSSTVLFLLLLEGLSRLAFMGQKTGTPIPLDARVGPISAEPHPTRIWYHQPSSSGPDSYGVPSTFNSVGFRDSEIPRVKPPGTVRIIVTGDSSVYGHALPAEFTFPEFMERTLNRAFPELHFDVINTGVSGYSSLQSIILMKEVGFSVEPDIWVFCNLWSDQYHDLCQDREEIARRTSPWPFRRILERSALYRMIRYLATAREIYKWRNTLHKVEGPRRRRVPLPEYEENLAEADRLAVEHGCELVFLLLPEEDDMGCWSEKSRWNLALGAVGPDDIIQPWDPYRRAMRQAAERLGRPLVDLPPIFKRYYDRYKERLLLDPVHPNPLGNRLIAWATLKVLFEHPELWPEEVFVPPEGSELVLPPPSSLAMSLEVRLPGGESAAGAGETKKAPVSAGADE